ncbi:MAG: beta-L-arabinofuranosidase domain-containing protein [Gemmatimonadota bacterium]
MKEPILRRPAKARYRLAGQVGQLLDRVTDQWLVPAPLANPAMLEMFADRDRQPLRDQVPWAGEFAGKYLTSAVQVLRLTGDRSLRRHLAQFARRLVGHQAEDGYLGPWPSESRLTGSAPNCPGSHQTWDAWGHYHVMLGLLLWYEESGDERALDGARRAGDLLCDRFLGGRQPRLVDTGSTEMNLAPIHSLALLYRYTRHERHLEMARQIAGEFAAAGADGPLAGDYVRTALSGHEFCDTPKPRWESLHPILGMLELYYLTGEEEYRRAFEHVWWSIVKLDRHNNGGFTSGERAQGNPYHQGAIETCCTVAWLAMSVEMLRLTGNPVVADEIELSTLNSGLGLHSPSGRWVTYNTPMDGVRKASAHDIVFQAREGTPELNCCSVNGPRALGLISDWALMEDGEGLVLNYYGPGALRAKLGGDRVTLEQKTDYPRKGKVRIGVGLEKARRFGLKLRIPYWSERSAVRVNGEAVPDIAAGSYLSLDRRWKDGDRIELSLDLRPHFWVGERECAGRVSVYRGPILLTYDRRLNAVDPAAIPALAAADLPGVPAKGAGHWLEPWMAFDCPAADGSTVRLCDFASAGDGGSPYRSWLVVTGAVGAPFSPANPLRSGRPQPG